MRRPGEIADESALDDLLSEPDEGVVATLGRLDGDLIVLGVGGKMGPSLARMARRAGDRAGVRRRVIGVSRFGGTEGEAARRGLEAHGVEALRADLLDPDAVARLPEAPNVVYLAGKKFGTADDLAGTWAMNAVVPAYVAGRFRSSRIVALSTGNVYPLMSVDSRGAREGDPTGPVGEYAMSCLGRERVFEAFSRRHGTPTAIIRLNYACDLRYGVPVDLARKVLDGLPIDLTMGHFNVIWQGDADAATLRAFGHVESPPWILNVTGPEVLSVRDVCREFGRIFGREPRFVGEEAATALLSDASRMVEAFGPPRVPAPALLERVAAWVGSGGRSLGKPTHFESRRGEF